MVTAFDSFDDEAPGATFRLIPALAEGCGFLVLTEKLIASLFQTGYINFNVVDELL